MNKLMIYRAVVGATLLLGAVREKVWGVDMLVKTIDADDDSAVAEHKADGWTDNPQLVIDGLVNAKLKAEKGTLTAEIGLQKRIDELVATVADKDKLLGEQQSAWAVEKAQLTAEVENLNAKVADLMAELDKLKKSKKSGA